MTTETGAQHGALAGRVALVTGAGSGIGAASAERLARAGARVALVGRTAQELEQVASRIRDAGGQARVAVADVADAEAMQRAADETAREWGRLDVVFANAGVNGVWAPIEELAPEEFESTLRTNLLGTFLTIKYAVPHLKQQGGSVIVCASVNGTRVFSNTGATAYSASKAGQVAMTKMLALELAKHRVRVNVVCPGAIDTNIDDNTEKRDVEREKEPVEYPRGEIPLTDGKPGRASQVADLVLFLASDASSHVTGTEVWIDGGESLLVG
jgi:NAD(P)-dependent dehydrogenase (short-subunit alcohol dehydrogenase family)